MGDDDVELRARGWRTLATLHARISDALEKALQAGFALSVVEFAVLDTLDRQDGWHMRMQQLAQTVALSHSATTRLVTRLEKRELLSRYLCDDDRRGIYSTLAGPGKELLERARPVHDATLEQVFTEASTIPALAAVVEALRRCS